jgi:hypothetical protein
MRDEPATPDVTVNINVPAPNRAQRRAEAKRARKVTAWIRKQARLQDEKLARAEARRHPQVPLVEDHGKVYVAPIGTEDWTEIGTLTEPPRFDEVEVRKLGVVTPVSTERAAIHAADQPVEDAVAELIRRNSVGWGDEGADPLGDIQAAWDRSKLDDDVTLRCRHGHVAFGPYCGPACLPDVPAGDGRFA